MTICSCELPAVFEVFLYSNRPGTRKEDGITIMNRLHDPLSEYSTQILFWKDMIDLQMCTEAGSVFYA